MLLFNAKRDHCCQGKSTYVVQLLAVRWEFVGFGWLVRHGAMNPAGKVRCNMWTKQSWAMVPLKLGDKGPRTFLATELS
jgi:hypothetical protein